MTKQMRDESLIGEQEAQAAAACLFHGFSEHLPVSDRAASEPG